MLLNIEYTKVIIDNVFSFRIEMKRKREKIAQGGPSVDSLAPKLLNYILFSWASEYRKTSLIIILV